VTKEQATAEPTTYQRVKSDWNQMTRVEQIQARHQLWSETPLPDSEYAASWADIEVLLSEVAQLREAIEQSIKDLESDHVAPNLFRLGLLGSDCVKRAVRQLRAALAGKER
jgi:hypothetical protein